MADVDLGASTFSNAGNATMDAIKAAASARPDQADAAAAAAATRCRLGAVPGQWKPCATGGECYKATMECDGGEPDCADGTDESPGVCKTTTVPAVVAAAPAAATHSATPTPTSTADTPGSAGMSTATIAFICAALLIVGALVVAWRHGGGGCKGASSSNSSSDDEQVQGMSMSFANPGFQAPRPAATEDDGELYEDSAPPQPHYDEAGPGQPGAQPSYSEVGDGTAAAAATPRAGSVVNQTYADLPTGVAPAGTTGRHSSGFPASGAVAPADMLYLDTHLVAAPSMATAPSSNYDLGSSNYDLGSGENSDSGNALATRYDHDDSMSEEEI